MFVDDFDRVPVPAHRNLTGTSGVRWLNRYTSPVVQQDYARKPA